MQNDDTKLRSMIKQRFGTGPAPEKKLVPSSSKLFKGGRSFDEYLDNIMAQIDSEGISYEDFEKNVDGIVKTFCERHGLSSYFEAYIVSLSRPRPESSTPKISANTPDGGKPSGG